MSARITSKTLVSALRRQVEAAGGHAMVLTKGDEISGAVILALANRGVRAHLPDRSRHVPSCPWGAPEKSRGVAQLG